MTCKLNLFPKILKRRKRELFLKSLIENRTIFLFQILINREEKEKATFTKALDNMRILPPVDFFKLFFLWDMMVLKKRHFLEAESVDMGFVFLGGKHNSSKLLHIFASTQVLRRSSWTYSQSSLQVNLAKPQVYLFANVSFTLVTFVINIWSGICILRKERTSLHRLIVFDCFVNVVSSFQTSFIQSPWSTLGSPFPCLVNPFLLAMITFWNRLVPFTF